MLKFTGVETGLVCDQDMYEMMDAGLRGGMTQTAWKKVAANNTYMETDYDKNQEISCNNYLFRCKRLKWFEHDTELLYRNSKWDDELTEANKINYMKGKHWLHFRCGFWIPKAATWFM